MAVVRVANILVVNMLVMSKVVEGLQTLITATKNTATLH